MYSWGDDDTSSWDKGGYSYDSARKPYLDDLAADSSKKGGRSYIHRSEPDMKLVNPFGKEISSDSENIIVVGVDVTGSMSTWPAEIFDRLPLLYQTLSQYKPDLEIAFAAIGDATCDNFPLQVNHFGKGVELEDHINALFPEGGGGGQISETYELFGYFLLQHTNIVNAKSPFLFIFGDEKFYPEVDSKQVEHYIGDVLQNNVESDKMWQGVMRKFNTFYLQKPYGHSHSDGTTKEIHDLWANVLGEQRVIKLPSKERAVDVAMGIVAKYWGEYGDFKDNISARHDTDTIGKVDYSIRYIPNDPNAPITRESKLLGAGTGYSSKRLD